MFQGNLWYGGEILGCDNMEQLYFDGMAIYSQIGFPDLFITFTCNPCWPEIQRLLNNMNLQPQDCPDIISRVFKMKFDELLCDVTKKHVLGRVVACEPHEIKYLILNCSLLYTNDFKLIFYCF